MYLKLTLLYLYLFIITLTAAELLQLHRSAHSALSMVRPYAICCLHSCTLKRSGTHTLCTKLVIVLPVRMQKFVCTHATSPAL